jgi:enoyl-CoA hydratase/carnithine racemase
LEEGIRMTTRIVGCKPEAVEIGMPVEVVFEDISPEYALPMFQPADASIRLVEADPKSEEVQLKPNGAMEPSDYRTILYEISGTNNAVCTITLNRPEKFNAINRRMAAELIDAFRRIRDERSAAVVVLTGAGGKAFCTGGDLEIFPSLAEHQAGLNWLAHEGLDVQRSIGSCEKVVICKINGHCLAGGLELALACDLLYAKASAKMGATEINMGILPGWGGTARLPRSMPVFRAREIIFSGRKDYRAGEMYEMGLLTRVFDDDAFEAELAAIVANLASKKPNALRMAKEIMARSVDGCDLETALALERSGIQWLSHAPEIQAMMDQFRTEPNRLTQHQKEQNVRTDQGKR